MSSDIRPTYYSGPFEPVKIIQHYQLPWELGDALAYILRAGIKNKDTETGRKVLTILSVLIEICCVRKYDNATSIAEISTEARMLMYGLISVLISSVSLPVIRKRIFGMMIAFISKVIPAAM